MSIDLTFHLNAGCGDNGIRVFQDQDTHASAEAGVSGPKLPSFELVLSKPDAHSSDVNCVRWSQEMIIQ